MNQGGRICLDTLLMPPKGAWTPALSLAALLKTIQALMASPNADDGLVVDITEQYRRDFAQFEATARRWTRKHASPSAIGNFLSSLSLIGVYCFNFLFKNLRICLFKTNI